MTRSRSRALLLSVLAAFSASAPGSPRFAAAQDRGSDHAELDPILIQGDPAAAAAFLRDEKAQARLQAEDPDLYSLAFARAAELKDMADLIQGLPNPVAYRRGLNARQGCTFCQRPSELLSWASANLRSYDESRRAALRKAVLEWDSLDQNRRDWLSSRGQNGTIWRALDLRGRRDALQPWATAEYQALKNAPLNDAAAVAAYRARLTGLDDALTRNQADPLWDRLRIASSAVSGLEKARRSVAASGDPALKNLLAQAENAADPAARLALLSRIFDGLGVTDPAVLAAAPPRAGQVFDADSRRTTADLLKSGLMREIDGTLAGKDLNDFFSNHTFDLRVGAAPDPGTVGWYSPGGAISINEEFIQRFLKTHGRDIRDLEKDPPLLRALTVELAPLFVHESTHQRQYAWALESRVHEIGSQNLEMEAMETEALFVIEKSKLDPSFLALLKKEAGAPGLATESLNLARDLARGGAAYFRDHINSGYYPDELSLEGDAWKKLADGRQDLADVAAELRRRSAQSSDEQNRLRNGPEFPKEVKNAAAWAAAVRTSRTSDLEGLSSYRNGRLAAVPADYNAGRFRLQWVNGIIEDQLNSLLAAQAGANFRAEVPPPSK
jgi:hypothetical protein